MKNKFIKDKFHIGEKLHIKDKHKFGIKEIEKGIGEIEKEIEKKIPIIKNKKTKKESDILFVIVAFGAFILIFFWNIFFGFGFLDSQKDRSLKQNLFKNVSVEKSVVEKKEIRIANEEKTNEDETMNKTKDPFITKNENIDDEILVKPFLNENDPILGNVDARLSIIEYSDFTCDFCKEQEDIIKKVLEKYGDDVMLVWKNYPDTSGISLQAAVAGHCAYEQGKFWEYHDLLFRENEDLSLKTFFKLAEKLELNADKFNSCVYREESFDKILIDIREANALQISGVPFFFVGDQEILGSISGEDLEKIIEIELNK